MTQADEQPAAIGGQPRGTKLGRYDFTAIEARWQAYWAEHDTFKARNPGEPGADTSKPKFYILDMFPYPSGSGLHVGHPLGYCATDIIARYKRMRGFNVLHPMGYDAFGLPAEQYAIEHNVHPADTTRKNIDRYRQQLKMFGFSYDWDRELATSEPKYYRFTQWIFLQMYHSWFDATARWAGPDGAENVGRARPIGELVAQFESGAWGVTATLELSRERSAAGRREWSDLSKAERRKALDLQRLAYLDEVPVNWCPALGTVLSNEEVDSEGRSERGNHPVYRRPLKQWMMRITKYAERLLADLAGLDWPEPIKLMQRNWIGRSTGAEVVFPLAAKWTVDGGRWVHQERPECSTDRPSYDTMPDAIRVYTTRHDTLFGATYMVLAPEHELVGQITTANRRAEVKQYVDRARHRSELDRTADTKEKTGVFTGAHAINPVTGEKIPIWIADYVLMGYGTGAIMAVPSGDTRDYEFAKKFGLPMRCVVKPTESWLTERLEAMVAPMNETAAAGFDAVLAEFPDLGEAIAACREAANDLTGKTLSALRDRVGMGPLIAHYVRHCETWGEAFAGEGEGVNSPPADVAVNVPGEACSLNGLPTPEAKRTMTAWLSAHGVGREAVNYKLRDWIFSRQKYWGEPFPIMHAEDGETVAVGEDELPVALPPMEDFKPTPSADDAETLPEPPLGRAKEWVFVERDGRQYKRDLNTMPQWAGSCWYYLRFLDPHNEQRFCDAEAERYWMPVDLYIGGAEHAVLHLLYARFWHKVLYDLSQVTTCEPFQKLFNQGMIQSFAYKDHRGVLVPIHEVSEPEPEKFVHDKTGQPLDRVVAKMSKALKNVVNPDEIIEEYGADTFRLYEMYMGPLDQSKPWNTRDVPGLFKLCQRVWRLVVDEETDELSPALVDDAPSEETLRMLHKTIQRVTEDLEQLKLNTAIAALFDFVNHMTPLAKRPRAAAEPLVLLLSPFAPHLGEELWNRLGHEKSLAYELWPTFDPALARDDEVEIAVQIMGKVKARLTIAADADETAMESAALANEQVQSAIAGKTIRKVIVVKGRLVNIVTT